MKKIWTLSQVARALGVSRQRADRLWRQGRLPHDIEDQAEFPYWSAPPSRDRVIHPPGRPCVKQGILLKGYFAGGMPGVSGDPINKNEEMYYEIHRRKKKISCRNTRRGK